jgi:hypothetical protein
MTKYRKYECPRFQVHIHIHIMHMLGKNVYDDVYMMIQDHMYLILEGRVRILEANGNEVKTVGPGECFGEMAVIHSDLGEKGWLRRESAQVRMRGYLSISGLFISSFLALLLF